MAKGLVRAGYTHFHFSKHLANHLEKIFDDYEADFDEIWKEFHTLPTVLGRLEKTGVIDHDLCVSIGTVGMTARASGIMHDIRTTHPFGLYSQFSPLSILKHHGDVYARTKLRHDEIIQSLYYLRKIVRQIPSPPINRQSLA